MAGMDTPPQAVLFDRDGTLVFDVPYNPDPAQVQPKPGVLDVLESLRSAGIPTGVLTNQSGVARGYLTLEEVTAVNNRVDELLGPFDVWCVCPHGPLDGCGCRKPKPGMVLEACRILEVEPRNVAFIGDIGADVEAATAAGARGVLVPTGATLLEEVTAAEYVVADLAAAVELLFPPSGPRPAAGPGAAR